MEMFFFLPFFFHIWLNKIHLCKQTQDEALTKPNKQENKQATALPVGRGRCAHHPLGHSSLAPPRAVIGQFPFT